MRPKVFKTLSFVLGAFKILIALFMMFAGVMTIISPLDPTVWLLSYRVLLVGYGLLFFGSGLVLFLGKILRKNSWISFGLQAIFYCFIFGALLNGFVSGWSWEGWMGNLIAALIMAGLWLWWKFKDGYTTREKIYRDLIKEHPEIRP